MNPKVSIIIPTHNKARMLSRAIKSILNQTFQDFELIIVDDCSIDNTREAVEWFQKKHKQKKINYIYLPKNSGAPAYPSNIGIKNSTGEYVAFLDHDDEWLPEKLEKQLQLFEKSPGNLGFIGCNALVINEKKNGNNLKEYKLPRYSESIFLEKLLETNFILSQSGVMIKKAILKEIGLFDEKLKFAQDWDMWIRISNFSYKFDFIDQALFKYYIHSDNISKNVKIFQKILEYEYLLSNHKELYKKYPYSYSARLRNLGSLYVIGGNLKTARKLFIEAIKLAPWQIRPYLNFVISLLGTKIYEKILYQKRKMTGDFLID